MNFNGFYMFKVVDLNDTELTDYFHLSFLALNSLSKGQV